MINESVSPYFKIGFGAAGLEACQDFGIVGSKVPTNPPFIIHIVHVIFLMLFFDAKIEMMKSWSNCSLKVDL